ncbi:CLUMA_CG006329, isoform A [Clunio marinus]|uniref:Conserved oligomeric Golgi complex subunit 3 n=1 Tax=Clunio marinus TaxID=568069 RepID=A0A1J1I1P0_9DIPT|nr:CLUMA_CG006329, isoform A [Clunio marinus]
MSVNLINLEHAEQKKFQNRVLMWDDKMLPLAKLGNEQVCILKKLEKKSDTNANTPKQVEKHKVDNETEVCQADFLNSAPIEATPEFLSLFEKFDDMHLGSSNNVYSEFYNQMSNRKKECNILYEHIEKIQADLDILIKEYEFVYEKTSLMNTASDKLIQDQNTLNEITSEIRIRLKHFNDVDTLIQRLQNPTFSVASDTFTEIISNIDESEKYIRNHLNFKEALAYEVKYKQCRLKAVQMIKNYVIQILATATDQVLNPKLQSHQKEEQNSLEKKSETSFAIFYGKFQVSSVKIQKIIRFVEDRCKMYSAYEDLLSELHQYFLTQRVIIMSSSVDDTIKNICVKYKGDHCTLVRSTCTFLIHICQDEHRLFYQFFSVKSSQMLSYLEGLCNILYDNVRPFIIHINHLETLAEICGILKTEMLHEHVQQNFEALETMEKVLQQLLQDTQERLVFRAHLYLQSDIQQYHPSPGDLAYPDKLEMMESIAVALQDSNQIDRLDSKAPSLPVDSEQQAAMRTGNSPADMHGMWYPTVRRTLVFLSRLYRCVDRPIFQCLSQEALAYCIQNLSSASNSIAAKKTNIDGKLFEIKHLLILREQIAPFRVDFTMKQTSLDFSRVKTAAFELLQKRKQLFSISSNNALLEFFIDGAPEVKEQLLDSRKDVDRQLKISCEFFITNVTTEVVGPVLSFIENAEKFLKQQPSSQPQIESSGIDSLRKCSWSAPQQIHSYIQEAQRNMKNKLPGIQRSMQLYLSNKETELIMFRPIRNNIIASFVRLEELLVTNRYSNDDMLIVNIPTADQVSVTLSSASLLVDANYFQQLKK